MVPDIRTDQHLNLLSCLGTAKKKCGKERKLEKDQDGNLAHVDPPLLLERHACQDWVRGSRIEVSVAVVEVRGGEKASSD